MTKISAIGTTETSLSNVAYVEAERGDGTSVKVSPSVLGLMPLIQEQTPSGTGTASFTSIPATFRDLILLIRGRGTAAASSVTVNLTINSDSGANYDRQRLSGANTT